MSEKNTTEEPSEGVKAVEPKEKPKCFVIMPISDRAPYPAGHFKRVYNEIIIPAVEAAGYEPKRADDSNQSHLIMLDILKSIVNYDMAICDVSGFNPNVLYELGIRQMARKPVVLIQDNDERLFDISGINAVRYDNSLRVDLVRDAVSKITEALINTKNNYENKAGSLIDLLGIEVQVKETEVRVTEGEKMILDRLSKLESKNSGNIRTNKWLSSRTYSFGSEISFFNIEDNDGTALSEGDLVINIKYLPEYRRPNNSSIYLIINIKEPDSVVAIDLSNILSINYFKAESGVLSGLWKVQSADESQILLPDDKSNLQTLRSTIAILRKAPLF